jgi:hypothetical protein
MTTIRWTYRARSHSARMRVANVMRKHRARKPRAAAPDTRTPLEKRLDEMEREGTLVPSNIPVGPDGLFPTVAVIPGAVEQFLAERHRPWE